MMDALASELNRRRAALSGDAKKPTSPAPAAPTSEPRMAAIVRAATAKHKKEQEEEDDEWDE